MNRKNHAKVLARGGLIAALYVVLTLISAVFGLSSGVIQLRLSEALTILPYFLPEAVPALAIGCVLANFVTAAPIWDVIFGSLATLLGAIGARLLRRYRFLVPLPTVLANGLIIPLVLIFAYGVPDGYLFLLATVTAGEVLSAYVLGLILLVTLEKRCKGLFT
ncbi:MAG: QueT transporter family protein [Clostridia bacterium]|nr:QueT transporter family protein [Clostridia bacterium]